MWKRCGIYVLVTALAACGPMSGSTQSKPDHSPSTRPANRVVVYTTDWGDSDTPAKGTADVTKPSDLTKLKGAPADFVDFVGKTLRESNADSGDCPQTVSVDGVDSVIGVALGGVTGCGGAEVLWIRRNGHWQEATGTQMGWSCEDLEKFRVPQAFAPPTCHVFAGNVDKTLHYGGPGPMPKAGTPGRRVVYMTTLNADSSGADGVTIRIDDDLKKLKGAPSRFVDAMEAELGSGCTTMVYGIDPKAGVATGSTTDCINAGDIRQIIWIRWSHSWIEVATADGRWPCSNLKDYRIPDDLTGSVCSEWDDGGNESIVGYDGPGN